MRKSTPSSMANEIFVDTSGFYAVVMADRELAEALVRAASSTNLARVRELLAYGADPNVPGEFGRTALPLAVRYAYHSEADAILIVEALLAAGADINAS